MQPLSGEMGEVEGSQCEKLRYALGLVLTYLACEMQRRPRPDGTAAHHGAVDWHCRPGIGIFLGSP